MVENKFGAIRKDEQLILMATSRLARGAVKCTASYCRRKHIGPPTTVTFLRRHRVIQTQSRSEIDIRCNIHIKYISEITSINTSVDKAVEVIAEHGKTRNVQSSRRRTPMATNCWAGERAWAHLAIIRPRLVR